MPSTVYLFVVLLGVVGVVSQLTADNNVLSIGNPNGLMTFLLPTSLSVTRQLPSTTVPPPTTPAGTQPPPSPGPNQANTSDNAMPPMGSPPPPPTPTGSVMPSSTTPPLTTGVITLAVVSIRELDSNFTQVRSKIQ